MALSVFLDRHFRSQIAFENPYRARAFSLSLHRSGTFKGCGYSQMNLPKRKQVTRGLFSTRFSLPLHDFIVQFLKFCLSRLGLVNLFCDCD